MEAGRDSSLFLVRILEELDSKPDSASCQDLCRTLCARLDLVQLGRLRRALFYTACLDPHFPASLFKDKAKGAAGDQQSQKIMVAADIVTMFNLIQMSGGATTERPPPGRQRGSQREAACPSCRPAGRCEAPGCGLGERPFSRGCPAQPAARGQDCPRFEPASPPSFLLEPQGRAASLDRLQALAPYSAAGPPSCEMQRTCFPTRLESEPLPEQARAPREALLPGHEPFPAQPCVQKRDVFREDFRGLLPASPGGAGPAGKAEATRGDPRARKDSHKVPFFNHSFEMPPHGAALHPACSPDPRRAKHESLGDLQASTYFGPAPGPGAQEARRCLGRPGRQTPWPAKSWSLNTEEAPDFERSFLARSPSEERLRFPSPSRQAPGPPAAERCPAYLGPGEPPPALPGGYVAEANGHKSRALSPPVGLQAREPARTLRARSAGGAGGQPGSDTSSVGTQTEQRTPEPQEGRDPRALGQAGPGGRRSAGGSEAASEDISDIFRFLDEVSVGGSTGPGPSSCCNSTASLSQLPRSDCDSSPECSPARARSGPPGGRGSEGRRPEEELRTSVCRLLLRVGEVERKLESLSGVRDELSRVLGRLSSLDQRLQRPEKASVQTDLDSLTSEAPSDESVSPSGFRACSAARGPAPDSSGDWCCSDASGSLHGEALKRGLSGRRCPRALAEASSTPTCRGAGSCRPPRGWRSAPHAGREGPGEEAQGRAPGEGKDWPRKSKEVGRQLRPPRPPRDGFLVEQVFSPQPHPTPLKAHLKSSPLYTDMRLTELAEVKRGQPPWTAEEHARNAGDKGKLPPLDLQSPESLNPNNLEYWVEDAYAPGYDSLLKRKEAEFRRARVCKMAALVAAAACTVILVIVVPICTMKS